MQGDLEDFGVSSVGESFHQEDQGVDLLPLLQPLVEHDSVCILNLHVGEADSRIDGVEYIVGVIDLEDDT